MDLLLVLFIYNLLLFIIEQAQAILDFEDMCSFTKAEENDEKAIDIHYMSYSSDVDIIS